MSLSFTTGNEHAPDDPFGRIVLEVDDDGAATLQHFDRTSDNAWTGTLEAAERERLRAALERAGFPDPPPHAMPVPGASMFELELDGQTLMMPVDAAARVDGYDEALEILLAFARELSGGAYRR